MLPTNSPPYLEPMACAASSIITMFFPATAVLMAFMSAAKPNKWTGMTAFVVGVIAAGIRDGSMLKVAGSISTNTGFAPTRAIEPAVATKLKGVVMTSSPAPTPAAIKARTSASEPEAQETANFALNSFAYSSSRALTSAPKMKIWLSITPAMASITSPRIVRNCAFRSRKSKVGLTAAGGRAACEDTAAVPLSFVEVAIRSFSSFLRNVERDCFLRITLRFQLGNQGRKLRRRLQPPWQRRPWLWRCAARRSLEHRECHSEPEQHRFVFLPSSGRCRQGSQCAHDRLWIDGR